MIPVYNIYIVKTILCKYKLHILEILACGMNFIFLSLSRPAGRDKLIFTQRPKRIAAISGTLSGKTWRFCQIPPFVAARHLFLSLSPAVTFLPGAGRICPDRGKSFLSGGGAGIEQSEMTERVSHPRAGTALLIPVSYTHLRAHETDSYLVCRLLLEKKKKNKNEEWWYEL